MKKALAAIPLVACLLFAGCGGLPPEGATIYKDFVDSMDDPGDVFYATAYIEDLPDDEVRELISDYEAVSGEEIIEILAEGTDEDAYNVRLRFTEYVAGERPEEVENEKALIKRQSR